MDVFFALISAFAYAVDNYFVRQGLEETPEPLTATVITLTVNFVFFVAMFLMFVPKDFFRLEWIYLFIIAGALAPGCARALSYRGIETLGLSISVPILNGEALFAVLMAILFLNEPMSLPIGIGVVSVVSGLVLLGYETGRRKEREAAKRVDYRYLFFPIMASFLYGVSVFFRKLGLVTLQSPILGAMVTSGTSWCIFAVTLMVRGNVQNLYRIRRRSLIYFILGGVLTCVAWLAAFTALSIGRVSIVTPIATCYSLITLLLSYALLRRAERITATIVLATALIIGGVVILSLAR
jgi:uncharacterized membrane protein